MLIISHLLQLTKSLDSLLCLAIGHSTAVDNVLNSKEFIFQSDPSSNGLGFLLVSISRSGWLRSTIVGAISLTIALVYVWLFGIL